jgi:predicted hydrocarbon binding protein
MSRKLEAEINDDSGVLSYSGARVVLAHDGYMADLQKRLESIDAALAHRIMYENGEQTAARAVSETERLLLPLVKAINKRKVVEKMLLLALDRGYGLFRLGTFDYTTGKGMIMVGNSPVARNYGATDEAVCFTIAGIIAGAAHIVWSRPFKCIETKCAAHLGGEYCEFKLFPCTPAERESFLKKME